MNKTVLYSLLALLVLILIVSALFVFRRPSQRTQDTAESTHTTTSSGSAQRVAWEYSNVGWKAKGNAPECDNPVVLKSPVDLAAVTEILYPGQVRGEYKPHGGFRLGKATSNTATVTAPMDAYIVDGSRYLEQGEVQYMFDFVNSCGVMYRLDHLLTLGEKLQKIADTLPAAQPDQSQTTNINPPVAVSAGETLATAVGHTVNNNVSFDWGVYDLRQKNAASADSAWAASHDAQLAHYAVCWFDWLSAADSSTVKSLPAGDPTSGKTSDYCK